MKLGKLFSLSREGERNLYKAIMLTILHQISVVLPVILMILLTEEMLNRYATKGVDTISLWKYVIPCVAFIIIIYFIYRVTYKHMYIDSGNESAKMRIRLAEKFRKLPLSYLGEKDMSDFTSALMDDVNVIEKQITSDIANLFAGIISSVTVMAALAFYNWQMALALFICIPVSLIVIILSKYATSATNRKNRQLKLNISDGLQEFLENIKVLKASTQTEKYITSLSKKITAVIPWSILYELLVGIFISISYNVLRLGLGIVIIFGTYLMTKAELSVIGFILFIYIAVRIYDPLTNSLYKIGEFIFSLVSANRIKGILNIKEQKGDLDVKLNDFNIHFNNVTFGYQEEDVIKNVSFTAKQGEITALVGPSGCGKSTLCKLACRFWDVQQGEIVIDGKNINDIHPETLLSYYSIVFQDVILFNDSIFNNIKVGNHQATDEEVYQASKMARCDDFINKLPQGYDTIIGENGQTLSGGERQRISIARAFLKQAPIILLDEATASLDPENETLIQDAIGKLIEGKTVIIIAHRLRTIEHCDQIIALKQGEIVEKGTHEALMVQQGLYHKLMTLQRKSSEWQVSKV